MENDLQEKPILDACCGSRMFWFDKENPNAVFMDIRSEHLTAKDGNKIREIDIDPDVIGDFTDMPFGDGQFKLVVFDPPHLKSLGKNSWMAKKYGRLEDGWEEMIRKGFEECFRVLDKHGILVFKWSESEVSLSEVLKLTPHKPLFGHTSGRQSKTIWVCFINLPMRACVQKSIVTRT